MVLQVLEEGTRMPDEVNYETHLLTVEEAVKKLYPDEARVMKYATYLYQRVRLCGRPVLRSMLTLFSQTLDIQEDLRRRADASTQAEPPSPSSFGSEPPESL
jgi:hypothetical protein